MELWVVWILTLTVAIAPLIFCPVYLLDGYLLPQIGIVMIGVGISSIFFTQIGVFSINITSILLCLYLVYLMISTSWSTVPHNSLREMPLVIAYSLAFLIASSLFCFNPKFINVVCFGIAFAAVATSCYGLLQKFRIELFIPQRLVSRTEYIGKQKHEIPAFLRNKDLVDTRSISSLGNTNFFCGYLLSTLPFLVYLSFVVSSYFIFVMVLVFTAIVATKSRAGYIGITCSAILFLILCAQKGWLFDFFVFLFEQVPTGVTILLYILLCMFAIHAAVWARKKRFLSFLADKVSRVNNLLDIEDSDQSTYYAQLRYRLRYWRAAFKLILQKPLQGFGLRTYRKEVYDAQANLHSKDNKFLSKCYQTPQPREVHNDFIENFVEGGFVGGLLFLSIFGLIIYHGFSGNMTLFKIAMMSSLIGITIGAFFFFPLRLGPSAVLFWLSLAMVETLFGNIVLINFQPNLLITLFAAGIIAAIVWEGVVKPNLGNYYFAKYERFSKTTESREKNLHKAMKLCPKETIFRTYAMIGYFDILPEWAARHAEVMRHFYDGMTPGWIVNFNYALAKRITNQNIDAEKYFSDSFYHNPQFNAAMDQLKELYPLTPLPKGGNIVKKVQDEGMQALRYHQSEIRSLKNQVATFELAIGNIILSEKIKGNIPETWAFNLDTGMFLAPQEVMLGKYKVQQLGPAKIPLIQENDRITDGENQK